MNYTKIAKQMLKIIQPLTEEFISVEDIVAWLEDGDEDDMVAYTPSELADMFMEDL